MSRALLSAVLVASLLGGCGGGGGGSDSPAPGGGGGTSPPPSTSVPTSNLVTLQSETGDPIGRGNSYRYTSLDSRITVTEVQGTLTVKVVGEQQWDAQFVMPAGATRLQVGSIASVPRWYGRGATAGSFHWNAAGRDCPVSQSTVSVDQVTYSGTVLTSLTLGFRRICEGSSAAFSGTLQWTSADASKPSTAMATPPASLWRPDASSIPAAGNYLVLDSEGGDPVGLGDHKLFTSVGDFSASWATDGLLIGVRTATENWTGRFAGIDQLGLKAGYYADVQALPFHNPLKGGHSWIGNGRACEEATGWFIVDSVSFSGVDLLAVDLRFEQKCKGASGALRGALHWVSPPRRATSAPVTFLPAGSWQAPSAASPVAGNFLYVTSGYGDFVWQGRTELFDQRNSRFFVTPNAAEVLVQVYGRTFMTGQFLMPTGRSRIEPGIYDNLPRYLQVGSFPDGAMSWFGDARGCNSVRGWTAIDRAEYVGNSLVALDLRFEQACDGFGETMRGQLHWTPNDATIPDGPRQTPALTWPRPAKLPTTGNFVHLQSDPGDFVGKGGIHTYTSTNSVIEVRPNVLDINDHAGIQLHVDGDEHWQFQIMPPWGQALTPGYYPAVVRPVMLDVGRASFDLGGESRGCNEVSGWLVIDGITYSGSTVTSLDARFEQHCESANPAMRGVIHYVADDPTRAPGPVLPAPAELWQPPAGAGGDASSFLYMEGEPGNPTLDGANQTFAAPNATFIPARYGNVFELAINGNDGPTVSFRPMDRLPKLEPGYYGSLVAYPFGNPARGGLGVRVPFGCNSAKGWFVVDSVTFAGDFVTAIDARFEHHCAGSSAALRGRLKWRQPG